MAQFILTVFHDPGVHAAGTAYQSEADMQAAFERVAAFNCDLQSAGQFVFACGLTPPEEATQVSAPDAATSATAAFGDTPDATTSGAVTAGPVGTGPFVGGFWIVEAPDREAAEALAARGAAACGQPLEVRALQG